MKYKCYLPCRGELGWMLISFVKRFHSDDSPNKIICCKPGHECLFPTATHFFYDWQDIPDIQKAGVIKMNDEEDIKLKINQKFLDEEIEFYSPSEISWDNKHDFAQFTFIPQPKNKLGLKVDVVITPRNRKIETHRNWKQENWQFVVDKLKEHGITVGICGIPETSFDLNNITLKSYDYIDIDSDVEMMSNAKLVITQESGLQYLSFMCQRPTFCIDHYHKAHGADLHRNLDVPFKELNYVWEQPEKLVEEILSFLEENNDSSI